jgi:hypothetical protein
VFGDPHCCVLKEEGTVRVVRVCCVCCVFVCLCVLCVLCVACHGLVRAMVFALPVTCLSELLPLQAAGDGMLGFVSSPLKRYITQILQKYLGKYIKGIELEGTTPQPPALGVRSNSAVGS